MMVRAKFTVTEHKIQRWSHGEQTTVVLEPRYDTSIPEDQRYAKATPSGRMELTVDNLAALKPGTVFYVDFTEVTS